MSSVTLRALRQPILVVMVAVALALSAASQAVAEDDVKTPDPEINNASDRPYSKYDVATDKTSVMVFIMYGLDDISCRIFYTYDGKTPKRPKFVTFELGAANNQAQWEKIRNLFIRFGNTKLTVPARYRVNRGPDTGRYFEFLTAQIPTETFQKVKNADALYFVVNDFYNYGITSPYMKQVKLLASGIPAGRKPTKAKPKRKQKR